MVHYLPGKLKVRHCMVWFLKTRYQGSITGVPPLATPNNENVVPSFCLLALQDSDHVVCYVYELRGEKVDVSKTEFRRTKPDSTKSDALMSSLMQ